MNTVKNIIATVSEPDWGKYILKTLPGLLISTIIGIVFITFVSIKVLKNGYLLTIKQRTITLDTLKVTLLSIPIRLIGILLLKLILKYYFYKNSIK
jgi:hypothetical protein